MLKIKTKNAMGIFREIMGRIDLVEVRGESVEHIFFIRNGIKQLVDGMEIIEDEADEKKKVEEVSK